jgi:hypothetical protein
MPLKYGLLIAFDLKKVMYDPKSNKNTGKEIKPAPYADAAVADEDLTALKKDPDPEDDVFEENDLTSDADDFEGSDSSDETDEVEEIEIEDIDDLDEDLELDEEDL